ncbi:hypothetical protein ACTHR6_18060 [Ralstonia holmesii]|uniref:hypothetical protein n=1 Tax=Ralstonia TaxID=48736 RepID=UPI00046A5784|nr:hypothetical protein [Ralstonia pickettii]
MSATRLASLITSAAFLIATGAYGDSSAPSQTSSASSDSTKGYFPRYAAAGAQERALFCFYALANRRSALTNAGTEHGGLTRAEAEAAWPDIDNADTQSFVYGQIARTIGPDTFDAADRAAVEAAISVSQEDPEHVRQHEEQLANVCGTAIYDALKARGVPIQKIETIYRDGAAKDRAHFKASFIEQATKPFHP